MEKDERFFIRQAADKAWEKYSGRNGWDYVILTASNAEQGKGFRAQLEERLQKRALPARTRFGVVPDPEGERVGNGGALLGALRYVMQRESRLDGLKILVILSSGDSRRVAQYSAVGKVFSPVPRVLPDGRLSTLFDEAMITLSAVPEKIRDGVLVISGDVMLAFDAEAFDPGDEDAAAIAFPEPAATGAGHGVFLDDGAGRIARVWHKQSPEALRSYGAVDADGRVNIDTGAVFFGPRVAAAIYGLICENGRCTDESFHRVVNGYLAPSLYVDFFYPLAVDSTFEGYMREIPEGKWSDELLALRERIWAALRPFRIRLCRFYPSRFIHFGTTADVLRLMSEGIDEYAYLGWQKRVGSCMPDGDAAAYNSYVGEKVHSGNAVYLEDALVLSGTIGSETILSGVELDGETVPDGIVLHCLQLSDGGYVTRIYGVRDNPKAAADGCLCLFGMQVKGLPKDTWQEGEERNLWLARIYPVCATRKESVRAALDLYASVIHGEGLTTYETVRRESLWTSFCGADGKAIRAWQKRIEEYVSQRRQ